jgi:hypothetical protein
MVALMLFGKEYYHCWKWMNDEMKIHNPYLVLKSSTIWGMFRTDRNFAMVQSIVIPMRMTLVFAVWLQNFQLVCTQYVEIGRGGSFC